MELIHIVLGKANPERMNGVNKVVHELASRQAAAGYNVCIWGLARSATPDDMPRVYATRIFVRPRFPFALPQAMIAAMGAVGKSTVFHLHGGFLPQMYSFARLLHRRNIPFVFTPHGSYNALALHKNGLAKYIYRLLFEQPLLRHAGSIHLLGQTEAEHLERWQSRDKIALIPYGFDAPDTPSAVRRQPENKFVIGFCGRADIYTKGLDALIGGFSLFHEEHPESELRIIGDGRDMPVLKRMVHQSAAAGAILLYGARYGAEKTELLNSFEVFAHPSRNEGLPASILEAAAAGIPCLVTRATNTGEAVSRFGAGVVIGHTDAQQIYEGLKSLYENIRKKHNGNCMSGQARQMIREAFNWNTLIKRYDHMYQSLLL